MRLMRARPIEDIDDEAEVSGWEERQRRKNRRRRRRQDKRRSRFERVRAKEPPPRRAAPVPAQPELDDELEPEDDTLFDVLDEALEEMEGVYRRRQRRRERRFGDEGAWSRAIRMSRNLRIQAARGTRAAVVELRPGLYLVAEMPEEVMRSQFGFVPVIAPLMMRAASRAMRPDGPEQHRHGLFRRRQLPAAQPPQLPGPVQEPEYLPPGVAGWADPQDVAEVLGCDACGRRRCE